MADHIRQILSAPDKGASKTYGINGVLARLFRTMLKDLGVDGARWGSLMSDYLTDPRNAVPENKRDKTSARGNINKELFRPQMTWKVFFKGLRFLKIAEFEIQIITVRKNGQRYVHVTNVVLDTLDDEPSEQDEFDDLEDES